MMMEAWEKMLDNSNSTLCNTIPTLNAGGGVVVVYKLFLKEPDHKYFRLCGQYGLYYNYLALLW